MGRYVYENGRAVAYVFELHNGSSIGWPLDTFNGTLLAESFEALYRTGNEQIAEPDTILEQCSLDTELE